MALDLRAASIHNLMERNKEEITTTVIHVDPYHSKTMNKIKSANIKCESSQHFSSECTEDLNICCIADAPCRDHKGIG